MAGSEFNLRIALALTEEVRANSESVIDEAQALMAAGDKGGFGDIISTQFKGIGMIESLIPDLDRAIALCDDIPADVTVAHPEDPEAIVGVASVKATALFYRGMVELAQGGTPKALEFMEQSLAVERDQTTLYNIGLIFLRLKDERGDRGIGNKILGRTIARMVRSGAEQEASAIDAFRKCAEMDSESEIGVKAGMELAQLGQL